MKRFSEQFKKKSDSIRLRASERSDLRARLTAYMEYHPLPAELKTASKIPAQRQAIGILSGSFKAISINMTYVRTFAGVFAVFMVVGVPIIAEKAIPGDMLYSVKTNITEEVRASLTLSPYAKVEWETERLERRVAEARLLATKGKLTPEAEATVAQAVQVHTDAAQKGIASMRKTNEDEAAIAEIAFASAMEVQSEVLEGHIAKDPDSLDSVGNGQSIVILASIVNGVRDNAAVAQAGAAPSYEGLLAKVEAQTTRAYELFVSVQQHAGSEEILNIERRLADIGRKIEGAIMLRSNNAESSEASVVVEAFLKDMVKVEVHSEEQITVNEVSLEEQVIAEDSQVEVSVDGVEVIEPELMPEEVEEEVVVEKVPLTDDERKAQAIVLLRAALTDVQKLIIFMTDIDVRQTVAIEKLVPVTYTSEERIKTILNKLDAVLLIQSNISLRTPTADLAGKVSSGNRLLVGQLESVTKKLTAGDIDGAEKVIIEAQVVAEDLQKLVAHFPKKEPTEKTKVEKIPESAKTTGEVIVE